MYTWTGKQVGMYISMFISTNMVIHKSMWISEYVVRYLRTCAAIYLNKIRNMKKTKFVSFFNQKGGVGKSTLCTMLASYMHHSTKKSVCVVDADNLQQSILEQRREDRQSKDELEKYMYRVAEIASEQFYEQIYNNEDYNKYDIILVDLPGNLWQKGVIPTLCLMDLIVIPTGFSDVDINSTNKFVQVFDNNIAPGRKKADTSLSPSRVIFAFNRVNKRQKEADAYLSANGDMYLKNALPDSVCFQRGFSTVNEYEHYRDKKLVKKFCREIENMIKTL